MDIYRRSLIFLNEMIDSHECLFSKNYIRFSDAQEDLTWNVRTLDIISRVPVSARHKFHNPILLIVCDMVLYGFVGVLMLIRA